MTKEKIENTTKISIFKMMLKIRLAEETIAEKYSEQKMRCPTHLCIGQEAVSAAVGYALNKSDYAVSTHRSHGHYLGKGGDLNQMIAEIYGKETGCSKGYGGSMHLVDKSVGFMGSTAIVGNSIPVGIGLALASKLNKSDLVTAIFLGEGAIEEGVFAESVNFAAQSKLPVLFVCENNLYSVYSPLKVRQPEGRKNFKMVQSMGIDSYHCDGNNAMEVYNLTFDSVKKIRNKKNPVFLEFSTYRWREHCGPNFDNHLSYRSEEEFSFWRKTDPIKSFEKYLLNNRIICSEKIISIKFEIQNEVNAAFDFAENSNFPKPEKLYENIYMEKN